MIWYYLFGILGGFTGAFMGRLLSNKLIERKHQKNVKKAQAAFLADNEQSEDFSTEFVKKYAPDLYIDTTSKEDH